RTTHWVAGFYCAALVMFIGAGLRADMNVLYYVGVGLGATQFAWQIVKLDIDDPQDCLAKFKSNKWLGLVITVALAAGQLW
ncbi:MAG: 4-hydroxybenzoate octaprenyltransferase, partial [Pseudomonadota bacterium]|nr:4-hydroxybenzoate octaprenyltransferase [Pseudomonadota bacterium]